MGKATRREYIIVVPDKYWTSSLSNIKWITKESNAKKS
jgi:hypothetical protein